MPTKLLQVRVNGSKYGSGIGFEGPGVVIVFAPEWFRGGLVFETHGILFHLV